MDAIFGVALLNGHELKNNIIASLVLEHLFYGHVAQEHKCSGVAIASLGTIAVLKAAVAAPQFIKMTSFHSFVKDCLNVENRKDRYKNPMFIIGTCGKEDSLYVGKDIVGPVNGSAGNADTLAKLYKTPSGYKGGVCTIPALVEQVHDKHPERTNGLIHTVEELSTDLYADYSYALIHRQHPHQLCLVKSGQKLSMVIYEDIGIALFGAYSGILHDVVNELDFGDPKDIEIKNGYGVCVDAYNNTKSQIDVDGFESHLFL